MAIITHLLAAMGGGIIAVIVLSLCKVAGEADDHNNDNHHFG